MSTTLSRRQFLLGSRPASRVAHVAPGCLELKGIVCQACRDACPAGAVTFFPLPGGFARPAIEASRCTGCGDCLPACPASAIALGGAP